MGTVPLRRRSAALLAMGPLDTIGHLLGMPIETSRTPPTPTVTRVSRASRTVRRSSGVAESSR